MSQYRSMVLVAGMSALTLVLACGGAESSGSKESTGAAGGAAPPSAESPASTPSTSSVATAPAMTATPATNVIPAAGSGATRASGDAASTGTTAPTMTMMPPVVGATAGVSGSMTMAAHGGAAGAAGGLSSNTSGCCPDCICRSKTVNASDLDKAGPYKSASFTVPRGTNFGGATVYYPMDADPPWAYAAFCPPYTATQVAFAEWGPFFASHGIVLATMDSVTTGDYPPQRAMGLEELMGILKGENERSGSPLMGKLHSARAGVLGWSMGGGGVWIASGKHPEWKSAVTLAGHNITATGWEASAKMSTVPTMMLNGATDTSILGGMNQTQNAYAAIPDTTPKLMYIMSDLGHFDWGTPTAEMNAAGRYVMAWEHYYLEGDERYKSIFVEKGPKASTWQTNVQ